MAHDNRPFGYVKIAAKALPALELVDRDLALAREGVELLPAEAAAAPPTRLMTLPERLPRPAPMPPVVRCLGYLPPDSQVALAYTHVAMLANGLFQDSSSSPPIAQRILAVLQANVILRKPPTRSPRWLSKGWSCAS